MDVVVPKLVRFRADPSKIRVSVMRAGPEWRASVVKRENPQHGSIAFRRTPEDAVEAALQVADGIHGVDLGMERAYDHPWLKESRTIHGTSGFDPDRADCDTPSEHGYACRCR